MQTGVQSAMADDSFNDVFDRDSGAEVAAPVADVVRDDQGRFAPKSEPPVDAPKEAQPEAMPEPTDDRNANRHVPLSELLAERERFKREKTLREEMEKRASEHEARAKTLEQMFQQVQRPQPQQQPQQAPPQQAIPDPYTDPEAYAQYQSHQQFLARRNDIANMSEAIARRAHGSEIVDKAIQAAQQAGIAQQFYLKAADPYGELLDWHKHQTALQRIGPDPDAYEKALEAKLREKILSELKTGQGKPQPKFPGSLADATATGSQGQHLTEEAIANELFSPTRNRRA